MEEKEKICLTLTIELYNILLIVAAGWSESFTKIDTNKNAISERVEFKIYDGAMQ